MNTTYKLLGVLSIVIVIAAVLSYMYLSNPTFGQQPNNNPTPTPTVSPTASPTATPTHSPTTHPTATPTTSPTNNPTATPAPTPTPSPTPTPAPVSLTGAGATFPYPLLNAMIINYTATKPYIQVNYQSIGSGGGISAMQQKTVDFGCFRRTIKRHRRSKHTQRIAHSRNHRCSNSSLQPARYSNRSTLNRTSHRRHLPRNHNQVERPSNPKPKPKH